MLYISHSSMKDFRDCPRFYFYKRIRKLERPEFNIHFLVGRVVHVGVYWLFRRPEKAIKRMLDTYKDEVEQARKDYPELTVDDEQNLVYWKVGVLGMLRAFKSRYSVQLRKTKFIANEVSLVYPVSRKVTIVGKLDNIIAEPQYKCHELKTAKGIDEQRINSVKTDPQTSLYFEICNRLNAAGKKLKGIVYDIIKKPSIRQKQTESKTEYIERLGSWYESLEGGIKFHRERMDKPLIDGEAVLNTVVKVADQMMECKTKDDYYQDFNFCVHDWSNCSYYDLCHRGGETKANLKLYVPRKPYKVAENRLDK